MRLVMCITLLTFLNHVHGTEQSEFYQQVQSDSTVQDRVIYDKGLYPQYPESRLIAIIKPPFVLPPITKDIEVKEPILEPKLDYLANPYSKYGFQYVASAPIPIQNAETGNHDQRELILKQSGNLSQGQVSVVGVNGTTSTINYTADEKIPEVTKIHTIGIGRGGSADLIDRRLLEARERLALLIDKN